MKKAILTAVMAAAMGLAGCAVRGAYVVRVPPPPPRVEVVGVAPVPGHVWVAGYHEWRGGGYHWVPGHWTAPPRPRAVWVPGRWVPRHGGYVFVAGRWR